MLWAMTIFWGVLGLAAIVTESPGKEHAFEMGAIFLVGAILLDAIKERK